MKNYNHDLLHILACNECSQAFMLAVCAVLIFTSIIIQSTSVWNSLEGQIAYKGLEFVAAMMQTFKCPSAHRHHNDHPSVGQIFKTLCHYQTLAISLELLRIEGSNIDRVSKTPVHHCHELWLIAIYKLNPQTTIVFATLTVSATMTPTIVNTSQTQRYQPK